MPKDKDDLIPLRAGPKADSRVTAKLQTGVLASVRSCDGNWCYVVGDKFDGWIEQRRVWGAYPNEKFD